MEPRIIWRCRDQAAFDRALELHCASSPERATCIERLRSLIMERIQNLPLRRLSSATEFAIGFESVGYTERHTPPQILSRKNLLRVRFRFLDDEDVIEVLSIESENTPSI